MRARETGLLGVALVACGSPATLAVRVAALTPDVSVSVPPAPPVATAGTAVAQAAATVAPAPPPPPSPPVAQSSCPEGEVWVPPTGPGGYVMGKGGRGAHRVVLTHGFCIDSNETSVRDYALCIADSACKEPWRGDPYSMYPARLDYPVNLVSWTKARAYCAWAGKRLPTEAEWEWAATGPEETRYPWGNEPEPSCDYVDYTRLGAPKWAAGADVGCGGGGPSPVGSHPKGDKIWPSGAIHDLAGNVWEWVEDSFAPLPSEPQTDPVVRLPLEVHAIRGGGWNRSYAAMVVTYRGAAHFAYQVPALGFRCVRGAPLPPSSTDPD